MKKLQSKDYWDFALALFLVVISITVLVGLKGVRPSRYEPLGPTFVPKVLAYCFIFMAAILVGRTFLKAKKEEVKAVKKEKNSTQQLHRILVVVTLVLIVLFIATFKVIGFRVGAFLFMTVFGGILIYFDQKPNRLKRFIILLITATILSIGLYHIFRGILGIRIP